MNMIDIKVGSHVNYKFMDGTVKDVEVVSIVFERYIDGYKTFVKFKYPIDDTLYMMQTKFANDFLMNIVEDPYE